VAQRRRHLSYKEAISAGSSPAGGTAEWTSLDFHSADQD
jgi:hypothetical protein